MKTGIAVFGSIIVDNISSINKYPKKGELTKILSITKNVGGLVPNVSIDLKRIDNSIPVFSGGKIGNDENGKFVLSTLKKEDIDTSNIITCNDKTSYTDVVSEIGGERTFFNYPGSSSTYGFENINFKNLNVKMIHLGYFLLLDKFDNGDGEKILKKCQELGIETSIDLVSENSNRYESIRPVLRYVDNLIINEVEASKLAGVAYSKESVKVILERIKSLGVKNKVIVHLPEGAYLLDNNEFLFLSSLKIDKKQIKGTTGAGDAFTAGALYGIYKDYSNKEILDFATKSAACSLFSENAVDAMTNKKEIEKMFANTSRR